MGMRAYLVQPGVTVTPPYPDDPADLILDRFHLGGLYFFVYPYFVQLREETGQLVDPSEPVAHFGRDGVPRLLHYLNAAREAALRQPEEFEQHIGKQVRPVCQDVYERVVRRELIEILDALVALTTKAQKSGQDVYLLGE